jgi:hypothetical protein
MSTNHVPQTHASLVTFGRDIMNSLIGRYKDAGGQFVDDPKLPTGLIFRCAGAVSLLLLANGFDELAEDGEWQSIVKDEFDKVREHVNANGFDATPIVPEHLTAQIFSPKAPTTYHYTDSVSWVLSFALHMRLAQRFGRLRLSDSQTQAVFDIVKTTLNIVCDAACPQGGWGFTNDVTQPDLYYSYGVSESLADFGDYVLGESASEIGVPADDELLNFLGPDLVGRVEDSRKRTSKWLIDNYLPILGSKEVNPGSSEPDPPHELLYYTYFVLDMLIVSKADEFYSEDSERINKGIEHGLYLSRIDFDKARADDDWWTDAIASSLQLKWENFRNPALLKSRRPPIYEPGLVPLSLRCNALYAYYIARGEDRKMNDLFQVLYGNRHPETGLWDSESFSLMVTERAVEAIIDFNDYLVKFQTGPVVQPPVAARDESVEGAFQTLMNSAVRSFLESPDGVELIHKTHAQPATHSLAVNQDGHKLDEDRLLDLLTSALADGETLIKGGDDTVLQAPTFNRFRSQLDRFLTLNFYENLKKTVDDESKHKALHEAIKRNETQLMNRLGVWFTRDTEHDLGDLFEWLLDKVTSDPNRGKK